MALVEVFRNEFSTITMDSKGPLVRSTRSDVPFQSLAALEKHVGEMIRTYDQMGREGRVLLNDLRAVQGRNDSDFEDRMSILRPKLYRGFVRVGILVRSVVGTLQIKRMVQEDGLARAVMTDEAELLEYLIKG